MIRMEQQLQIYNQDKLTRFIYTRMIIMGIRQEQKLPSKLNERLISAVRRGANLRRYYRELPNTAPL